MHQTKVNLGGEGKGKKEGSSEQEKGHRDGLTIRAKGAHFTHASSKLMEFALVAVERGNRKREREGKKRL